MDDDDDKRLSELEKRIKARQFREEIVSRVRDLASKGKIQWREHAFERIDERNIDALVAKRILQRGDLKNDLVEPGNREEEWVVTMVDRVTKTRDVGVVTVVVGNRLLRVITVEWEDL